LINFNYINFINFFNSYFI